MLTLLILLLLAFPIAAIVGVVMAVGTRERLRGLERRLAMLERRIEGWSAAAAAPPQPAPQAEPVVAPAPPPSAPAPSPPPEPAPEGAPAVRPASSAPPRRPAPPAMGFEERFGTQWVVWIGGLALALGGFFWSVIRSSRASSAPGCG
jgi:uncharacterized membrane protein